MHQNSLILIYNGLIVFISFTTLSSSFSTPRPVVPPRFDNFCEQIVGAWNPPKSPGSCTARQVEEVMRSCGGAVQGIREETNMSSSNIGESMYLNRADDGFVYFDCGTYTKCPTQLQLLEDHIPASLSEEDSIILPIVASISFSTQPKSRLVFDMATDSCIPLIKSIGLATCETQSTTDVGNKKLNVPDITWGKETICRMEHGDQPWVLQRAKWEASSSTYDHLLQNKCKMNADEITLNGWINSWDVTKNHGSDSNPIQSNNPNHASFLLPNKTSRIIDMGGVCVNSGEVKSLFIYYDDKGFLQAIVLKEGLMK
mmetsp:Transcript_7772/g.14652  ORF Transcript_7772/g.14652 Transcript_7772/m.14652 type:complete len:314 (+) Transcript_7772:52-993(+)